MNVMQLNTDIYNSLGVLSNDESYLEKQHVILKNWRKLKETWRMQRLRKKPLLVSIRLLQN